jgi:hypothetical protein
LKAADWVSLFGELDGKLSKWGEDFLALCLKVAGSRS